MLAYAMQKRERAWKVLANGKPVQRSKMSQLRVQALYHEEFGSCVGIREYNKFVTAEERENGMLHGDKVYRMSSNHVSVPLIQLDALIASLVELRNKLEEVGD